MKKVILLVAALLIHAATYAQDIKTWDQGPLEWSDFTISNRVGDTTSFSVIDFSIVYKKIKSGRTTYNYKDVKAAFHVNSSWVCSDYITDSELQFNQSVFDLMEFNARKYRDSLLFHQGKLQKLNQYFITTAYNDVAKYRTDKNRASFKLCDDDFDITTVKWKNSMNGFGISAGLTVTVPFGALGELVHPIPCLTLSATRYLKKNMITAELYYGIGKARKDYYKTEGIQLGTDLPGESVPVINVNLLAGRYIHQGNNLKLFFVAGPGYMNAKFRDFTGNGFTLTEGIGADIKFHDLIFFFNRPSHYENNIRVQLSAGQILKLKDDCIVPIMQLSVCFNMPGWRIIRG